MEMNLGSARRRRDEAFSVKLAQDEAFARIRLLRSPNIGPVTYAQLLRRFGNAVAAIDGLPDLAARGGSKYRAAAKGRIEDEIAVVRKAGARYLFHDAPEYPPLLKEIGGAPPILTMRGNAALMAKPCVAMVGARNASAAAVKLARDLAVDLASEGYVVVSGLARGIDGAAHRGALPSTIGVIASGIEIAYPPQHSELQEEIAQQGLLLAEQPPRHRTTRQPFSQPQSDYRRAGCGYSGGGGRAQIRFAYHRAAGGGGRARGDGDPRFSDRCPRAGLQPADPRRRSACPISAGRD